MKQEELKAMLDRYLRGSCSEEEKAQLDAFFNAYKDNKRWVSWSDEDTENFGKELFRDIRQAIRRPESDEANKPLPRPRPRAWRLIAASVGILLALGVGSYWLSQEFAQSQATKIVTNTTQFGEQSTVVLSDSSIILLNAGSTLAYPEYFDGNVREVTLIGEAFFEVKKNPDKPFIIKAGEVVTTVLGTSFNVNAYPYQDKIQVTVASGKVQVAATGQSFRDANAAPVTEDTLVLTPSLQATFHRSSGRLRSRPVDLADYLSWKEGIIRFNDIPLRDAARMLERQFDVTIVFENETAGSCYISNTFTNESLTNILESIKFIKRGIDYRFQDENTIMITGVCKN